MKALAFNGSPRMDKGNTYAILSLFIEGLKLGDAQVETFHLSQLDIKPCLGELGCWIKTPGNCIQRDDMDLLYPKIAEADLIIFATPIYLNGMSGTLKAFIDRLIPSLDPHIELHEGRCRHPLRDTVNKSKVVLVATSGFCEMENFTPVIDHMQNICFHLDREFAGAVIRPNTGVFPYLKNTGVYIDDIYEAVKSAGFQLAKEGTISKDTLATIMRETITAEQHKQIADETLKKAFAAKNIEQYKINKQD